jgi:hypothetical protein
MSLPKSGRYNKVMGVVQEFFRNEKIVEFPIDPFTIITRNRWGVIKYSELAAKHRTSVSEVISAFQSEDGYTIFDGEGYTIAYNDQVESFARIRFTLMHEIGHIYLGHLTDFNETVLSRSRLTEDNYKVLENEANCFARNTLAPAPIVSELGLLQESDLMQFFQISRQAAEARLRFLRWDLSTPLNSLMSQVQDFIKDILNTKYCVRCNRCFTNGSATYCSVCGKKMLLKRKAGNVTIHNRYELDERGIPTTHPRCENQQLNG